MQLNYFNTISKCSPSRNRAIVLYFIQLIFVREVFVFVQAQRRESLLRAIEMLRSRAFSIKQRKQKEATYQQILFFDLVSFFFLFFFLLLSN